MKELLELERPENLARERRSWSIERVGWLALLLLIGAALAGLLGPGALSTREARSLAGDLSIAYPRFMRVRAASQIQIRMRPARAAELTLWLEGSWTGRVRVLAVTPPPLRSRLDGERWGLVFASSPGSAAEVELSLDVEPRAAGRLEGGIALEAGQRLPFHALVYP